MNNKILAILGTTIISIGTIGSVAFANTLTDSVVKDNQQIENNIKTVDGKNEKLKTNSCHGTSENKSKNMIKIMKDNGFEDAARHMQTRDYDAMIDYMENLTEEDYDKMIKIMNENDYEHMGQMMKTTGRKGMIKMHKAMNYIHGESAK